VRERERVGERGGVGERSRVGGGRAENQFEDALDTEHEAEEVVSDNVKALLRRGGLEAVDGHGKHVHDDEEGDHHVEVLERDDTVHVCLHTRAQIMRPRAPHPAPCAHVSSPRCLAWYVAEGKEREERENREKREGIEREERDKRGTYPDSPRGFAHGGLHH